MCLRLTRCEDSVESAQNLRISIEDLHTLNEACYAGDDRRVLDLLEVGADVNNLIDSPAPDHAQLALQTASRRGHKKVVQLLLDRGANVNATGRPDGSALQAAAYWGHKEVI